MEEEIKATESVAKGGPGVEGVVPPVAPVAKPEEPLYEGFTGKLTTVDDLKTYTKTMEEEVLRLKYAQTKSEGQIAQPMPPPVVSSKDEFEELIYSDPKRAKEVLKDEIRDEMSRAKAAEVALNNWWNEFYVENEDLSQQKRLVQLVLQEKRKEIEVLPPLKAKEFLAKEARGLLGSVKQNFGVTETTLESKGAVTLGTSGQPAPKAPATPKEPISFAEQVKRLNKRRA